jgi:large conductance mechanosensitive channel
MGLIAEFKEFISKGSAFDLAIGVIVGGAFGPIINSMVTDIIMPIVSLSLGSIDFKNLYLPLSVKGLEAMKVSLESGAALLTLEEARKLGSVVAYGSLINAFVNFIFLMLGVFIIVKVVNTIRKKAAPVPAPVAAPLEPPAPAEDIVLLIQIRDLLKK